MTLIDLFTVAGPRQSLAALAVVAPLAPTDKTFSAEWDLAAAKPPPENDAQPVEHKGNGLLEDTKLDGETEAKPQDVLASNNNQTARRPNTPESTAGDIAVYPDSLGPTVPKTATGLSEIPAADALGVVVGGRLIDELPSNTGFIPAASDHPKYMPEPLKGPASRAIESVNLNQGTVVPVDQMPPDQKTLTTAQPKATPHPERPPSVLSAEIIPKAKSQKSFGTLSTADASTDIKPADIAAQTLTKPVNPATQFPLSGNGQHLENHKNAVTRTTASNSLEAPRTDAPNHPADRNGHRTTVPAASFATLSVVSPTPTAIPFGQTADVREVDALQEEPALTSSLTGPQLATRAQGSAAIPQALAPHVAQQIATATIQSKTGTTEIALNPEELGRVRMVLSTADAGLTVSILAERPETADLMRRNLEQLAREFRDLGYEDVTFTFSEHSDGSSQESHDRESTSDVGDQPVTETQTLPPITTVALSGGLDLKL